MKASDNVIISHAYAGRLYLFLLLFLAECTNLQANIETRYPDFSKGPLHVSVSIHINNIYNINTVDETYQVDGYIVYKWKDERMMSSPDSTTKEPLVYINDDVQKLMDVKLWIPTCEFINVQGGEECLNKRVEIHSDGSVMYTERFFETFISDMDFRSFPFDTQSFQIIVEPWGYNKQKVVLTNPAIYPKWEPDIQLIDKWKVEKMFTDRDEKVYDHIGTNDKASRTWTRVLFEVKATRLSGYYVWQILFPLLIIILASFVIFWIKDFGTQIGVGFSLMLTVVAFNFYSASILPKLPYNTFIEYVILVGYIFIFLGIIAVVINYRINGDSNAENKYTLIKWFRYLFPIVYLLVMVFLSFVFL